MKVPTESNGLLCPSPWPQTRRATHRPGGGGRNPTLCPQNPLLLTSDLQVGEGLHRNGDAERQQKERGDQLAGGHPQARSWSRVIMIASRPFSLPGKADPHILASPAANTLPWAVRALDVISKGNISIQNRVSAPRMTEGRGEW